MFRTNTPCEWLDKPSNLTRKSFLLWIVEHKFLLNATSNAENNQRIRALRKGGKIKAHCCISIPSYTGIYISVTIL